MGGQIFKNYTIEIFTLLIVLKQFSPLTNLLTPYFIENKNINNKYIHSKLYPIFFMTSFLVIPAFYFLRFLFNVRSLTVFVVSLKIIFHLIFIFTRPFNTSKSNKFDKFFLKVGVFVESMSTSLFTNIKGIIFILHDHVYPESDNQAVGNTYSTINNFKRGSTIISGLVAQSLYNLTDFKPIILITLIFHTCTLITSFFVNPLPLSKQNFKDLFDISMYKKMLTKEVIYLSTALVLTFVLDLCITFYINVIIVERKQRLPNYFINMVKIISIPADIIVSGYLKLYNIFGSAKIKEMKPDVLLFGYADAFSKIASMIFSTIYSKIIIHYLFKKTTNEIGVYQKLTINFLMFIVLIFFYTLSKTKSIIKTYLIKITLSSLLYGLQITLSPVLSKRIDEKYKFTVFVLIASCGALIHSFVSILARKKEMASHKIKIYFTIASALYLFLVILGFFL